MSTTPDPSSGLSTRVKRALATILIGSLGGLLVFAVTEMYRTANARPALKFLKLAPGPGYVDVYAKSNSSRPFLVHACQFRLVRVLSEPRPQSSAATRHGAGPRWLAGPRIERPPADSPSQGPAAIAPQRIEPEEVVIPAAPLKPGAWVEARLDPAEVDAYKTQRLRCKLPDAGKPGAKYMVEARIGYGDENRLTWETIPPFEIETVPD